jgi:hypothetical protein
MVPEFYKRYPIVFKKFLFLFIFVYLGFLEKSSCARTMKILTFYVNKFISSIRQPIYGNNIQTYNPKITIYGVPFLSLKC